MGIPNCNKFQTTLQTTEVLRTLRENLISVYSAHKPNEILGYNNLDDHLESGMYFEVQFILRNKKYYYDFCLLRSY